MTPGVVGVGFHRLLAQVDHPIEDRVGLVELAGLLKPSGQFRGGVGVRRMGTNPLAKRGRYVVGCACSREESTENVDRHRR